MRMGRSNQSWQINVDLSQRMKHRFYHLSSFLVALILAILAGLYGVYDCQLGLTGGGLSSNPVI